MTIWKALVYWSALSVVFGMAWAKLLIPPGGSRPRSPGRRRFR